MEKVNKNIPKLRFPQFTDEWEKEKLGNITTKMQSGISRLLSDEDIGFPIIRSNNLNDSNRLNVDDIKYWYKIDDQGANLENYILNEGDLLVNFINSLAQIGKVVLFENLLNRPTIFTTNLLRLTFKENTNNRFIFYFFLTEKYNKYVQSITKPAVNQASFTTKEFNLLKIYLPTLPEQKKIASFLTAVDKKIELLQQKKQHWQAYKKAMMQKLFSQEVRFKDEKGKEFPKWETKKMSDISKINQGLQINIENRFLEKVEGSHFYITNEFLKEGTVKKFYIKTDAKAVFCNKEDILMTRTGNTGKVVTNVEGVFHNNFFKVAYKEMICKDFLYYFLVFPKTQNKLKSLAGTSTIPDLNHSDFYKINMPVPTLAEQKKIANFLSALDKKIDLLDKKIEQSKRFKKYLLQNLFV